MQKEAKIRTEFPVRKTYLMDSIVETESFFYEKTNKIDNTSRNMDKETKGEKESINNQYQE